MINGDIVKRKSGDVFPGLFFTWDIQYQCNYRCCYCFLNFEKETQGARAACLKPEEWLRIWDGIYDRYGSAHIHITGGEPFAYPGFMRVMKGLGEKHSLAVSTNFSFDIDEFLSNANPDSIRIESSLHMEFVETRDFINKAKILRDNGYLISVTVVAYPAMLSRIKEAKEIVANEGFKLILFPYRGPYKEKIFPGAYDGAERAALRELGLDIGENVSRNLEESYSSPINSPEVKEEELQKICRMGQWYAKIMPSGEAFRCCASVWDSSKPWENWGGLGNIVEGTFRLLDIPRRCKYFQNCKCYKSMIVGEEERWRKHWKTVPLERELIYKEEELSRVKEMRDSGQGAQAKDRLGQLLAKYPRDIKSLTLLGELLVEEGALGQAEKALKSAEENNIDPDDWAWIFRVLTRVYYKMGLQSGGKADSDELFISAQSYIDKAEQAAIKANNRSDLAQIYYEQAFLSSLKQSWDESGSYIRKAMDLQPDNDFFKRFCDELPGRGQKRLSGKAAGNL